MLIFVKYFIVSVLLKTAVETGFDLKESKGLSKPESVLIPLATFLIFMFAGATLEMAAGATLGLNLKSLNNLLS
jgi:hypothetical protein